MPKGKRITKVSPQVAPAHIQTTAEWEAWVTENADYFTCSFKIGPGKVQTTEHKSLNEAIAQRAGNPRGMVYAALHSGRSVMIGPGQYEAFLKLRGEAK